MARGALSSFEKKLWAKFAQEQKSPVEQAKAKLQASAKRAMSRRNVQARRRRAIDATQHGQAFAVSLHVDSDRPPQTMVCSYRMRGNELEITAPIMIKRWYDWPPRGRDGKLTRMVRYHRRGTHAACVEALRRLGFESINGGMVGLLERVEAVGFVRIAPKVKKKFLDTDSAIHTLHHVRDGVFDSLVGMKLNKNGEPIWLGQDADDEEGEDLVSCHYNQIEIGKEIGIRVLFYFKPGMAPKGDTL